MMTQHCVDSTTRAAKDFGFNIVVIGDACATKDLELKWTNCYGRAGSNSIFISVELFLCNR
jgi:nicotinamidase-related amidase